MMHAASRLALDELRNRINQVIDGLSGDDTAPREQLSSDLTSVANLLAGQPRLRRTLADASTDSSSRGDLARGLFGGKIGDPSLDVVTTAVGLRWSSPWDLVDALELGADDALLAVADGQGNLDEVEDELFRFERVLDDSGDLAAALDESAVPADRRVGLLTSLLGQKAHPVTVSLLEHAVRSQRRRSLSVAIDDLLEASAERRNRSVARVVSASELTPEQTNRLASALTRLYGREITIRSAIDPQIQGGLVVRVGDEVINGTVAARLAAARTALAG